jgi:hypothetical protein
MNAECLGGERHFSDPLDAARLWRKRSRRLQELGAIAYSDRKLKAGKQGADNHRHGNTCSHVGRMDRAAAMK